MLEENAGKELRGAGGAVLRRLVSDGLKDEMVLSRAVKQVKCPCACLGRIFWAEGPAGTVTPRQVGTKKTIIKLSLITHLLNEQDYTCLQREIRAC